MNDWLLALLGLIFSWGGTWSMRHYALSRQLLDIPNARSSHVVPTPRGGGLAIVLAFLGLVASLGWTGQLPYSALLAMLGGGLLIAGIGFVDDHRPVRVSWRLLTHFAGALWALWWLGGLPTLPLWGVSQDFGLFGHILAAIYLVWLLNLYNFMDGIDGIASLEALTVAAGGALLWWCLSGSVGAIAALLLAACAAGFLVWNFPPARIFMGDVGSGFLGILLGIFSLWSAHEVGELFWCWLILLGVFVVDATTTLLRRVWRGQRFYEAHRSHAYQHAARQFGGHRPVSLAVALINIFWLLPVAALVAFRWLDGLGGLLLAYAPLLLLALRLQAGVAERQEHEHAH